MRSKKMETQGIKIVSVSKNVRVASCGRCLHEWHPTSEKPKRCASCKSPYWDKERKINVDNSGKINKYGFDRIKIGEWSHFPWFYTVDGELDTKSNQARARSLEQYMKRHQYKYLAEGVMSQALERPSGLYVMRKR